MAIKTIWSWAPSLGSYIVGAALASNDLGPSTSTLLVCAPRGLPCRHRLPNPNQVKSGPRYSTYSSTLTQAVTRRLAVDAHGHSTLNDRHPCQAS